jgi:hypothetical protein
MTIPRQQYNLGICPSPGKQPGIIYRTPRGMWEEYDAETNRLTVHIPLLPIGHIYPDMICDVGLCPDGQACGCHFETEVHWEILNIYAATVSWTWPADAG